MRIQFFRISGFSLFPDFQPGDYVLIAHLPFLRKMKKGDVVVFNHREYGLMIKKIKSIEDDGMHFRVEGSNSSSIDSVSIGVIASNEIIGKMIFHIKKKRISSHRGFIDQPHSKKY